MTVLVEFAEWCRQERQRASKQLAALDSGRCKVAEDRGHGWVDHTAEAIAKLTNHVAELDDLLHRNDIENADHPAADGERRPTPAVINDPSG